MGHSIVYCDQCGLLLKEEDFRQGKASLADNRSYCSKCRPIAPGQVPGPKSTSTRLPKQAVAGSTSSTRIPMPTAQKPPSSSRVPKASLADSRRLAAVPPPPPTPPAGRAPFKSRLLLAGLGAGAAALVGIFALFRGGSAGPPEIPQTPSSPTIISVPGPLPPGPPGDHRAEDAARTACVKAYEVKTTRPRDLAGQWKAFEAAREVSRGTSYAADAEGQLKRIRREFDEERAALEGRTQEALSREQLQSALDLWENELRRWDVPDWTRETSQRIADLKSEFERRLAAVREAATEAKRRQDDPEVQRLRSRVTSWGLGGYPERLDQALAEVVLPKPEKPPDSGGPAPPLEAYRARWKEVLEPVAGRDFPRAIKMIERIAQETGDAAAKQEAAEDLENLKLAAAVVQETLPLLPKLPRGQKISLSFWDPQGSLARIDDVILRVDANRLEIRSADGSRVLPFGEVAAVSLADLFRARPGKKPSDTRAVVVACLLDGDAESARKFRTEPLAPVNDKYALAAQELLRRRSADEREKAARQLFYEAELRYFQYIEGPAAAAKYRSLLADFGSTGFVTRNRAAIAARTETPRDFIFEGEDLVASPAFKAGKFGKGESGWVSQQDSDLARVRDNYVEFSFAGLPETDYYVWVFVGGCCQEVLTFYCQATELTAPDPANPKEKLALDPGAASGVQVRSTHSSLRRLHSQHNGPKNPEYFEWVHAGTFRFPTAGPKTIRLLSNQKGFAVCSAAALSTHRGPPREVEMKEFDRWRIETPGASLRQGGVATGAILREVWKDIGGTNVSDLTGQQAFKEDRPTESGLITVFEGPTDIGDNYGTRIRGYVYPPSTGAYVFWIASDDQGELWLSSDEDPAHKKKIAGVPGYTSPREWGKFPEQQSVPIELKAGARYYIEALHKEGGGGDHVSVGWQLPSGTQERPIPGIRLSPVVVPKK